jgi:hypothetical protein
MRICLHARLRASGSARCTDGSLRDRLYLELFLDWQCVLRGIADEPLHVHHAWSGCDEHRRDVLRCDSDANPNRCVDGDSNKDSNGHLNTDSDVDSDTNAGTVRLHNRFAEPLDVESNRRRNGPHRHRLRRMGYEYDDARTYHERQLPRVSLRLGCDQRAVPGH